MQNFLKQIEIQLQMQKFLNFDVKSRIQGRFQVFRGRVPSSEKFLEQQSSTPKMHKMWEIFNFRSFCLSWHTSLFVKFCGYCLGQISLMHLVGRDLLLSVLTYTVICNFKRTLSGSNWRLIYLSVLTYILICHF